MAFYAEEVELKVGYMEMLSGKTLLGGMKFKKRVFVLTATNFKYYDGILEKRGRLKGQVEFSRISVVEEVRVGIFHKPSFQISYGAFTLYIIATNKEEQEEWISLLRKYCCGQKKAALNLRYSYHPSCFSNGKWLCCDHRSKLSIGCTATFNVKQSEPLPPPVVKQPQLPQPPIVSKPLPPLPMPVTAAQLEADPKPHIVQSTSIGFEVIALYDFPGIEPGDLPLLKSQRVRIFDDSREFWWRARDAIGAEGYVPSNYVKRVEEQDWYSPLLSRAQADDILTSEGEDGVFIVRNSSNSPSQRSISICYNHIVHHYAILQDGSKRKKYYISEKHKFATIDELIHYHKFNGAGLVSRLKKLPKILRPSSSLFDKQWELDRSKVKLGKSLSTGLFGETYVGKWKGKLDVMVIMRKEGKISEPDFIEQAKVMKDLVHENLVNLYGVCTQHRPIFIVYEFLVHGSLVQYLKGKPQLIEDKSVMLHMALQICSAMKYLVSKSIIHRDLAARNCFVGENNVVKVSGFQLSRFVLDDEYTACKGTKFPIRWAALEVIAYNRFSSKSDVWAYGILLWELWTVGKVPYEDFSNQQVLDEVVMGYRLSRPEPCPDDVYSLMTRCWMVNVDDRPTFVTLYKSLQQIASGISPAESELHVDKTDIAESMSLFDEAMREGYVTLEMLKMMISGVAGSGKTSTLSLLLDQEPPVIRKSTPCARRPVHVIPIISDSKDAIWHVVEGVKLKALLADLVRDHEKITIFPEVPVQEAALESDDDKEDSPSELESATSTEEPLPITAVIEGQTEPKLLQDNEFPLPSLSLPDEDPDEDSILQGASATEDELVKLIDQSSGHEVHLKRRWISITDTGGQPQFQEVVSVFLRQTSLYIHVQKLSESLSEKPAIEYYDEQGKPLSQPIRSPLTNEEHVKFAVRSLQSLRHNVAEDKSPKMLFVATHEDQEDKCSETREEKEEKMAKLLLPLTSQNNVIYCGNRMEKVLFGINAKLPGDKEKKIATDIRNIINKLFPPTGRKVPLRWFVLQLKLQEIAGILQRQIITKKECLEAAHRIHLNSEEALDAALEYLDELNVIFYYPKILPDVVFCNIQVVIDKLTELVEHLYKLMKDDDDHTARMGDWKRFRDFGLITEAILTSFPSHYSPGIFTMDHLLTLFRALLVIADFQKDDQEEKEYFMPCLLHTVEPDEVEKHIADCKSKVPPLILHFPDGLLSGVFCFTIASLLSSENTTLAPWKLKQHRDGTPKCLHRNIVQFIVPGFPGIVTLIDRFEFIQIVVASPPSFSTELCPLVKNAVLSSLAKATELLNYIDCQTEEAILCQCEEGEPHPAKIIADPSGKRWWQCTEDESVCGELEETNDIWKDKEVNIYGSIQSKVHVTDSDYDDLLPILQVTRALENLVDWHKLGLLLEIPKPKLEMIRLDYHQYGQGRQRDEMLDLWLQSDKQASWDKLATALESMNERAMASQIRSEYCTFHDH